LIGVVLFLAILLEYEMMTSKSVASNVTAAIDVTTPAVFSRVVCSRSSRKLRTLPKGLEILKQGQIRVLVTGAAGFIGSHVAKALLQEGINGEIPEVVGLDDLSGGYVDNLPCGIYAVQDDLTTTERLTAIFEAAGPFRYVFHLAAYAAEGLSHYIRIFNYHNNLIASVRLLNEVVRRNQTARFVFASSIAVYGAAQVPFHEDDPPHPEDPYGIAKLAFEMDLEASRRMFGQEYAILRPHNVYGPGQNIFDKYRNVVGIFMEHAVRRAPLPIFGDGAQTRAFSYVTDVARAFVLAATTPGACGKAINVGSDHVVSIAELARLVSQVMGVPHHTLPLQQREEVVHAVANHSKQTEVFGAGEELQLQEGLQNTAKWVDEEFSRRQQAKPSTIMQIEVPHNMPPSWVQTEL